MKKEELLLERLIQYNYSSMYPFHMPGHKRKADFPNPYSVDITEIDGFDNLHYAEGILKESMEWAASVYGADHTYYLVNGSSGGILSSICAATRHGGKLLISRNAHKSVYHGVILNRLNISYVYPQIIPKTGIQGGVLPDDVEKILDEQPDIEAVLIVSPTYDGVVSDIRAIAAVVHEKGIPLIVDEAHGAHFSFSSEFPLSAISCGADIVIQSLHKTLSSLTQTAVMHVNKGYVDVAKIERYLQMFQTSSPSYVFMAAIEQCIYDMEQHGCDLLKRLRQNLDYFREQLLAMKHLKIVDRSVCSLFGIFDLDSSKIVISCYECGFAGQRLTGELLGNWLRKEYHLEMEMCGAYTVTAITSWQDRTEDLQRLADALTEIDSRLSDSQNLPQQKDVWQMERAVSRITMAEAFELSSRHCLLQECGQAVSAEFIYLYPPGIPIVAPGEMVTEEVIAVISDYLAMGLPVQGMDDHSHQYLKVIEKKEQGV